MIPWLGYWVVGYFDSMSFSAITASTIAIAIIVSVEVSSDLVSWFVVVYSSRYWVVVLADSSWLVVSGFVVCVVVSCIVSFGG